MKMQTVRDFTGRVWYAQNIVIVDLDRMPENANILDHALFKGENWQLRSDLYKHLYDRLIRAYGVYDGYLVIQLYK